MNKKLLLLGCALAVLPLSAVAQQAPVDSASLTIITSAPEGTAREYAGYAGGYSCPFGTPFPSDARGFVQNVVFTDGGEVYFRNPVPQQGNTNWMRGRVERDSVLVFEFPQYIKQQKNMFTGKVQNWYLYSFTKSADPDELDAWYDPSPVQKMEFVLRGDSILPRDPALMLGLSNTVTVPRWAGYGIYNMAYAPLKPRNVLPEGVQTEQFAMIHGEEVLSPKDGDFVRAAFVGDTVFIGGWDVFPDFWVKGIRIDENTVAFNTDQYLGIDTRYNNVTVMYAAEFFPTEVDGVVVQGLKHIPSVQFTFDPATKRLEPKVKDTGFILLSKVVTGFGNPVMFPQVRDKALTPEEPMITKIIEHNGMFGICNTIFSCRAVNGELLDKKKMYLNCYIDGSLLTFTPEEYQGISASMTDVPFGFNDLYLDFFSSYTQTNWRFYRRPDKKVGVQTVYKGGGEVHRSNIVYVDITGGVQDVCDAEADVVAVEYYTLGGLRVENPAPGIVLRRTLFADGTAKVEKIVVR